MLDKKTSSFLVRAYVLLCAGISCHHVCFVVLGGPGFLLWDNTKTRKT